MTGRDDGIKTLNSDFVLSVNGNANGNKATNGHFDGFVKDEQINNHFSDGFEMTKVFVLDQDSDTDDTKKGSEGDAEVESKSHSETKEDEGRKAKKLVKFSQLWRYATTTERLIYGFSCFCSVVVGSALPSFSLLYGRLINILEPSGTSEPNPAAMSILRGNCLHLGIGEFL
eukprot:270770-Hanusia_phi.AAC.1